MKTVLTILVMLALGFSIPAMAQDVAASCEPAAINTAIDRLVATYLGDRLEAEDTVGALQAAEDLQVAIAEVVAGCEGTADEIAVVDETDSTAPITGKWQINWSKDEQFCPDGTLGGTGLDRPIILRMDGDKIITEDIFVWPKLEYSKDIDGNYFYRRNLTLDDGTGLSFEYVFLDISASLIEGDSTRFYQAYDCTLSNPFQLVLLDENVICMAGSNTGANLRSGPGTDFDRLGALAASEPADVIGQATGSDGFVWWQLADESWVRSDLVEEAGLCENVPEVAT